MQEVVSNTFQSSQRQPSSTWLDDRQLMERVVEGDSAAQERVVLRVLNRTRVVCRSLLGNTSDAADAEQSTLEAVLTSAPRFKGQCSLETWADRIAARTAVRLASRRRFWRTVLPLKDEVLIDDAGQGTPAEVLPRNIREYLDNLAPAQREVLVLKYLLGYSVDEIAEVAKLNRHTVKYRLKRALADLRAVVRRELNMAPTGGKS